MDLGLNDKVVLITGGSKGIGFACARAFALEGAKVAIVSRDPANLARAYEQLKQEGLHVHRTRADLHEPHSAADIVEEVSTAVGPIDILINSAGAARRYDPETLDADAFRATMEAKYFPYIYPQQEVLRRMAERVEEAVRLEASQLGIENADALARGQAKVPLGRYAKPEEIADVALFLASRRASYVTGAIVPMDGGSTPLI